ncbi:sialate O-acetylesterase [Cohnella abietis]|uniref:9-O-acetylesterase n=1 Tax=Cohnella abietis TaxID=2507935 RepID=A0A3T1D3T5_9BACL|nr:sialate O-acetylesterase [Cohnella abietis]BBI32767.1 9-O-acetylesterase [Cohnella abietis]
MNKPLRLDPLFNDHMVIQRDKPFFVWGTGLDGIRVTVTCRSVSAAVEIHEGQWRVAFPAMGVGEPSELIVQSEGITLTLVDVVFGDVWLAGGQSNMEWPLSKSTDGQSVIEAANLPLLRYYDVPKVAFEEAGINYKGKWKRLTPENAGGLSAVAYYYARELIASENVPIGIIGCNWGATSASCWIDKEVLKSDPELSMYPKEFEEQMQGFNWQEFIQENKEYVEAISQFNKRIELGFEGEERGPFPWPAPLNPHSFARPSGLYETMLRKVFSYRIKGVIYYQGESDVNHPELYSQLLEALILDWRRQWQDKELPFFFVQLPIYAYNNNPAGEEWPLIREAQQLVAERVPYTGMAVLLDCGEAADIHPADKKPVGERLALLALDKVYGRTVKSSGPVFSSCSTEQGQVFIHFAHAEAGLIIRAGDQVAGFEVAAEDGEFISATAEISGNTVKVSHVEVPSPRYVRYGWANVTDANLLGVDGLPAAPFLKACPT